jgi:hypothetical protein
VRGLDVGLHVSAAALLRVRKIAFAKEKENSVVGGKAVKAKGRERDLRK